MTNEVEGAPFTVAEIQTAIDTKQFSLCYQPKIDCELVSLKGFEALIRWDHPTRGALMPNTFIPAIEELGMIGAVTAMVVDQAFAWYKSTSGVQGLSLSINISALRLNDLDFADWLDRKCRISGIRPDAIMLEISEEAVMDHRLQALDMFTRLRSRGIKIAIDDFGVGHSSLTLLAKLPFSEVKIDKSFTMVAATSEEARTFIKATVDLGHSLRLTVVAEGVEDRETLDYLRQIGCDFAHGYLISKPLTGPQAADWIIHRRQLTRHIMV